MLAKQETQRLEKGRRSEFRKSNKRIQTMLARVSGEGINSSSTGDSESGRERIRV